MGIEGLEVEESGAGGKEKVEGGQCPDGGGTRDIPSAQQAAKQSACYAYVWCDVLESGSDLVNLTKWQKSSPHVCPVP